MNFITDLEQSAGSKAASFQSAQVLDLSYSINCVLTDAEKVRPVFMTHYVNMNNDSYGVSDLISEILTERGAVFDTGIEYTSLRPQVVAAGMLTDEIFARVRELFKGDTKRYPNQTIRDYLSTHMGHLVGRVHMTTSEDSTRKSTRCRYKWYLVKNPIPPVQKLEAVLNFDSANVSQNPVQLP